MKVKELSKMLIQRGFTPEQILKIIDGHEKQKERAKKYQKEKYLKVSVSVKKSEVESIKEKTGITDEGVIKKYLAGVKLISSIPEKVRETISKTIKGN